MDLKSWLSETGTSQAEFAEKVKAATGRCSQALVSQWLRGVTRITRDQAVAIEAATGGAVTKEEALFGQPEAAA